MEKKTISCVIPTYNRCPHKDEIKYNPPWWAAVSLSKQKNVGEIIFVDDGSKDHTERVIKEIGQRLPIEIVYLKNHKNIGLPESRKKGIDSSKYDRIWAMDDDCMIIDPELLSKLNYVFNLLEESGRRVGMISVPVNGTSLESKIVPKSEILKVNKEKWKLPKSGNTTEFPQEYLNFSDSYIDKERGIFKPLKVDISGAVFLCDKEAYEKTIGSPSLLWRNACAEDFELSLKIQRGGWEVFYLPFLDKKSRVFHCRYGDPNFQRVPYSFSIDGISFNQILEESSIKRTNNGCRVDPVEEFYSNIMGNARIIFKYFGKDSGIKHLEARYSEIREDNFKKDIFKKAVHDILRIMGDERIISDSDYKEVKSVFN